MHEFFKHQQPATATATALLWSVYATIIGSAYMNEPASR